jgi:hypothetical protein
MRKLKKSESYDELAWVFLVRRYKTNTSTKRHSRLMHSLADVVFPNRVGKPRQFVYVPPSNRLSRSLRRAMTFGKPAPVKTEVAPERKLTGAVRRGMQRGRVA